MVRPIVETIAVYWQVVPARVSLDSCFIDGQTIRLKRAPTKAPRIITPCNESTTGQPDTLGSPLRPILRSPNE